MKKTRLFGILVLALVLVMAVCAVASAAPSYEELIITPEKVNYGKIDVSDIKMNDSRKTKIIEIENGALEAAKKQGKDFNITMDNVVLSFDPDVFNTAKYKESVASGWSTKIILTVELDELYDTGKYIAGSYGLSGDDFFCRTGFELSAEVYTSGRYAYDLEELASPMTVSYNYKEAWGSSITSRSEANIKMAWYDREQVIYGYGGWEVLSGAANTTTKLVSGQSTHLTGIYVPVVTGKSTGSTGNNAGSTSNAANIPGYATQSVKHLQSMGAVSSTMKDFTIDITRQEFISFLVKALKVEPLTGPESVSFSDVNIKNQYYVDIILGAERGLVEGYPDGTFRPEQKITRQEMAAFFNRAMNYKGMATDAAADGLNKLPDAAKVGNWAKENCAVAYNAGLISGRAEGGKTVFAPLANTSRAEACVMICRLLAIK